jgi:hypothetical protein
MRRLRRLAERSTDRPLAIELRACISWPASPIGRNPRDIALVHEISQLPAALDALEYRKSEIKAHFPATRSETGPNRPNRVSVLSLLAQPDSSSNKNDGSMTKSPRVAMALMGGRSTRDERFDVERWRYGLKISDRSASVAASSRRKDQKSY